MIFRIEGASVFRHSLLGEAAVFFGKLRVKRRCRLLIIYWALTGATLEFQKCKIFIYLLQFRFPQTTNLMNDDFFK